MTTLARITLELRERGGVVETLVFDQDGEHYATASAAADHGPGAIDASLQDALAHIAQLAVDQALRGRAGA
jgi:hypothetical protein